VLDVNASGSVPKYVYLGPAPPNLIYNDGLKGKQIGPISGE